MAVLLLVTISTVALYALYVAGRDLPAEVQEESPQGDDDFPPLDYRDYRNT